MKTLSSLALALLLAGATHLAQAQALRPEVGKPLQQAYELIKAGKGKEALAKVREADAAPNKSAAESLQIDRMKAAAAPRLPDAASPRSRGRRDDTIASSDIARNPLSATSASIIAASIQGKGCIGAEMRRSRYWPEFGLCTTYIEPR